MRYLIRTTPWHAERYGLALALQQRLPGAILVEDRRTEEQRRLEPGGFQNYVEALALARDGGAWLIEDDAKLVTRFCERAAWEVQRHPHALLQGYSRANIDRTRGERWRSGRSFVNNVCVYVPGELAEELHSWALAWEKPADHTDKRCDPMVRRFLEAHRLRYWNVVPNLADHRTGYSVRLGRVYASTPSTTFVA